MVPTISAVSGMMLKRTPAVILPTVITAASLVRSDSLEMMVCRPSIIFALIKIGSTPPQG